METIIDESKLEYWCRELPESAEFMRNFFLTCGKFSYYTNRLNYKCDIASYSSTENWSPESLIKAFYEIASKE